MSQRSKAFGQTSAGTLAEVSRRRHPAPPPRHGYRAPLGGQVGHLRHHSNLSGSSPQDFQRLYWPFVSFPCSFNQTNRTRSLCSPSPLPVRSRIVGSSRKGSRKVFDWGWKHPGLLLLHDDCVLIIIIIIIIIILIIINNNNTIVILLTIHYCCATSSSAGYNNNKE